MSETTRTSGAASGAPSTVHTPVQTTSREVVHEAYAFACMRCGHGWEQAYEIEHHVDAKGSPFVVYRAGGERVPSPLTRPSCANCGGQVVRIMRSGQVRHFAGRDYQPMAGPLVPAQEPVGPGPRAQEPAAPARGWHLSHLLHPFRNRERD